jgi:hypothetical protein
MATERRKWYSFRLNVLVVMAIIVVAVSLLAYLEAKWRIEQLPSRTRPLTESNPGRYWRDVDDYRKSHGLPPAPHEFPK